jgi:hypothetical protein
MLRAILTMLAVLVCLSASSLGYPCYLDDAPECIGTRILICADVPVAEIDRTQPCFVAHGIGTLGSTCVPGDATCDTVCAFAQEYFFFGLKVNGTAVEPTFLYHSRFTEKPWQDGDLSCEPPPGAETWSAIWVYQFPAGYFSPGVYVLEGTWRMMEYPVACLTCPEASLATNEGEAGWTYGDGTMSRVITRMILLSVH